jgi:hypothetical protein
MDKSVAGIWSFVGACALMLWVSSGNFEYLLSDLSLLVKGDALSIQQLEQTSANITLLGFTCAVCVGLVNFPLMIMVICRNQDAIKAHQLVQVITNEKVKSLSRLFVVNVFLEELIVRWFLLGFVHKINFFNGTVWFYVLFVTGNFIWAVIHLLHFRKEDRNLFFVVPQFLLGIFCTYAFLKVGFMGACAAHFIYNMLVVIPDKRQEVCRLDAQLLGIHLGLAFLSYALLFQMQ